MSKDHKRKARPIAPATVTCDADSITVVIPDVLGKNEAHVAGRNGERHTSTATKRYREAVSVGVKTMSQGIIDRVATSETPTHVTLTNSLESWKATTGTWRAEILSVWPRKRDVINGQKIDFICPMGDVDAPIAQVFDALQHAGILDDDARVCEVVAGHMYVKDQRTTVVRLVRVLHRGLQLSERFGHLTHLLPKPMWQVGDRCRVLGEGRTVFEVMEATNRIHPSSVYLGRIKGKRLIEHGREAVEKLERA
jgi:Holliday junction resolvase RusA-like endonuclease